MVTILAAVISAITAIAVAVVSASRKPPESKILELQKVLNEVSHSEKEEQIVKRAIARQFEKLDAPDYSMWFLVWAALGAVLVTMLSATVSELQVDNADLVVTVSSFAYLAGFVILLVAALFTLGQEVFQWGREKRSKKTADGDDSAGRPQDGADAKGMLGTEDDRVSSGTPIDQSSTV